MPDWSLCLAMYHDDRNLERNLNGFIPAAQQIVIGKHYWVQCKRYRCLAVMNNSGKWSCVATGRELADVVRTYRTLNVER